MNPPTPSILISNLPIPSRLRLLVLSICTWNSKLTIPTPAGDVVILAGDVDVGTWGAGLEQAQLPEDPLQARRWL